MYDSNNYERQRKQNVIDVRNVDIRLIEKADPNGRDKINTDILWYMHNPLKIKKMYFGKHSNKHELELIDNALKTKTHYSSPTHNNGYDVSFEYNPKVNKAWYSEEYKGCLNGHYYLALNGTHAMFYEDD